MIVLGAPCRRRSLDTLRFCSLSRRSAVPSRSPEPPPTTTPGTTPRSREKQPRQPRRHRTGEHRRRRRSAPATADGDPNATSSADPAPPRPDPDAPRPRPLPQAQRPRPRQRLPPRQHLPPHPHAEAVPRRTKASSDSTTAASSPFASAQGTKTPDQRAKAASQTLERLVEEKELVDVRSEEQGDLVVVFGGKTPIVQLSAEDATAAGDASLAVHAASVTAKVPRALLAERQRKAIAESVFSFSLLVFSGLIAVLLLGKMRELSARLETWIAGQPRQPPRPPHPVDRSGPACRGARRAFGCARTGSPASGSSASPTDGCSSRRRCSKSTRSYTERLTGFVLAPLSALIGRIGSALPLLVIALSAIIATVLLVRFVGLFFGSVAAAKPRSAGCPPISRFPPGALVRFGIVVVALLVAAPLITGNDDGALARAGIAALVALGFASSPVLASVAAGVPAVYGRKRANRRLRRDRRERRPRVLDQLARGASGRRDWAASLASRI